MKSCWIQWLIFITQSVTTLFSLAGYFSPPQCTLCVAGIFASSDDILDLPLSHVMLKLIQVSTYWPFSKSEFSISTLGIKFVSESNSDTSPAVPWWQVISWSKAFRLLLSSHRIPIFHNDRTCCSPLVAFVHMPLPVDILIHFWLCLTG